MTNKQARKQVSFNVTEEFHKFLKVESAKRGMSIKELVEKATKELIKKYEIKGE